jgi:DNA-directed RNA polymerase sigma subunit (sigma70/sigma32)
MRVSAATRSVSGCRTQWPVQALRGLGAELGISAERVRQIEQQALETIHAAATQPPTSS